MRIFLLFIFLLAAFPAYAEPPAFSDGEVLEDIPQVSQQETFTMADRLSRCGAYYFKTEQDERQFTTAAFRILTEIAYTETDMAEERVMGVFTTFQEKIPTMTPAAIEAHTQECNNLVAFKDDIIMMEREVYE